MVMVCIMSKRQYLSTIMHQVRTSLLWQAVIMGVIVLVLVLLDVVYPSTKLGFVLVIVLAAINPRLRGFGLDFMPFMFLLLTYNELRRFADDFGGNDLNIVNLINWEKGLFGGTLPGHWLQETLWSQWFTPVLDVLTNAFYLSHFITPVILAGFLWWFRRSEYWAFMIGLVVLSFAAFATYLAFPAAPPWWATAHGYLRSTPITLDSFVVGEDIVSAGPNPVAAMPSLHIGYPIYLALVSLAVWGRRALPVVLLPFALLFSAVYLGHHYVIDGIVGAVYALGAYGTVYWRLRKAKIDLSIYFWGRRQPQSKLDTWH